MKKYIFSLVCLCCTLLPALEGTGLNTKCGMNEM